MIDFPINFSISDFQISLHLITEILAFIIGYQLYLNLRKKAKDTITSDHRFMIIIGAGLGALIGSRLIGALEVPSALVKHQGTFLELILAIYQSKTILGGLLGGLFGVELVKSLLQVKESSGDLFTLPIILGMIIGRIGCFSQGIHEPTFGLPTNWITGMDLGDGILRHPTALYELFVLVVLFLLLWQPFHNKLWDNGVVFKIFMITYLGYRFLVGFIQPREIIIFNMGTLQIVSFLGILYYQKTIRNNFGTLIKRI